MNPELRDALVALLLLVGALFVLLGALGLVRLPDTLARLHAPTKATTLGVGCCLAASTLHFSGLHGQWVLHELLVVAFLFITAPVSAQVIARRVLARHRPSDAPDAAKDDAP